MKLSLLTSALAVLQLASPVIGKPKNLRQNGGRELIEEVEGLLLVAEKELENFSGSETTFNVEFPGGKVYQMENFDPSFFKENANVLKSGRTKLKFNNGFLKAGKFDIQNQRPQIINPSDDLGGRRLANTMGTRTVLVVNVQASDATTSYHDAYASTKVFNNGKDDTCLKDQMESCSYDKLKIEKAPTRSYNGNSISNGVVSVSVPVATSEGDQVMVNAVTDKLKSMFGVSDASLLADHVMVCLPPGTMSGIAYAYLDWYLSIYNDMWCTYPTSQMHEIAHNLNLGHANEVGVYKDQVGLMGFSYAYDGKYAMCFNGAKSWQLGWYEDRHLTFDPATMNSWSGKMYGIADYQTTTAADGPIIMKLKTPVDKQLYVTFNRGYGINRGSREAYNQVTVTEQGSTGYGPESELIAKLSHAGSVTLSNFANTGKTLTITVSRISFPDSTLLDTVPVYAEVDICLGDCSCTQDSECANADACNVGICTPTGCTTQAVENCCLDDNACDDGDVCTIDSCTGNQCINTEIPGCRCTQDSDCGDISACEVGSCSAGICITTTKQDCCEDNSACDDGLQCTQDVCNALNVCEFKPIANCLESCGNGICEPGETCSNCDADCDGGEMNGAVCGNGVCEAGNGENWQNCSADCKSLDKGKPADRWYCGAGYGCEARCGACELDMVPAIDFCCGDGVCSAGESSNTCSLDCS